MLEQLQSLSYSDNINNTGIIKNIILGGNGIYENGQSFLGKYQIKVSDYVANKTLPKMSSYVIKDKKLPQLDEHIIYQILTFYTEICKQHHTEAQVNIYYNKNNITELIIDEKPEKLSDIPCLIDIGQNCFMHIPKQKNSGAQTSTDDKVYTALQQQMQTYIETHSHNTMNAFRSGTDKENSNFDCLQLVFGHLNNETFAFHAWVTLKGNQINNLPKEAVSQFIKIPTLTKTELTKQNKEIPEEWYNQCEYAQELDLGRWFYGYKAKKEKFLTFFDKKLYY